MMQGRKLRKLRTEGRKEEQEGRKKGRKKRWAHGRK
jgi:hypothetical protein